MYNMEVIWWTFCIIFFTFLWKRMLNPEVLKTPLHWRHNNYVQQGKTMDNKFLYVKTLTSLAIWVHGGGGGGSSIIRLGPSWFTSTIYLFNNNLHVKYRSNLIRTFWVKIKYKINFNFSGSYWALTCFIYGTRYKKKSILWAIWGALRGPSMIRLGLSCFPAILSPYICSCQIRKQSDKKFKPKILTKINFVHIWGSWGALTSNPGLPNFRAVRPHHRANKYITMEKNNTSFSYMGPNVYKNAHFGLFGGGGGVGVAWVAHLASQLPSHLYQSTCQIWKQSD